MNSYLQKRQVRKLPERQRQPKASSTGFCAVRKDRHGMFLRKLGGVILKKTRLQRSACVRHIKQAVSREDRHGSRATKNVWHAFKPLQKRSSKRHRYEVVRITACVPIFIWLGAKWHTRRHCHLCHSAACDSSLARALAACRCLISV